jgi:pyrroloquinoline quinone biosynthesis protein B
MRIRILGSAAGGGLPQWNCRCPNCDAVRRGAAHVRPRTQSSVAVSADGQRWLLLNVSADVRGQVVAFRDLWPPEGDRRGTPIAGCVLTDAEIDHTSGLLQLREGCTIRVFSTPVVRRWLEDYLPIGPIVASFADRPWNELRLNEQIELPLPGGAASGISLRAFELGRDAPRFVPASIGDSIGAVVGLELVDGATGGRLVYAPCVPAIREKLRAAAARADCLLIDGTFWSDEEPQAMGIAGSTALKMGHLPVGGDLGSLAWLSALTAKHRVYVHINNTNPMLNETGREFQEVTRAGVRVGQDGDEFEV